MPDIRTEAISLGLTPNQLQDHNWSNFPGNGNCGDETLKYLRNRHEDVTVQQAMDNIRGLNGFQIQAISLGLTRDQLQGHEWSNIPQNGNRSDETLKYLRDRPEDVTVQQAMDNIRGLNGFQIQAIRLGLTRDQLQGHEWSNIPQNGNRSDETLKYLRDRPEDVTVQQAMDNIRGLNGFQIQAIRLGLTRDQLQGHEWSNAPQNGNRSDETLKYLRDRPEDVTVQQAMDNIRGLNGFQIRSIIQFQKRGMEELRLTPTQVYIRRFGEAEFNAINEGQSYRNAMPDAFEAICNMPQQKAYAKAAVSAVLGANLPEDVAKRAAPYLEPSDGVPPSQTSVKAYKSAVRAAMDPSCQNDGGR